MKIKLALAALTLTTASALFAETLSNQSVIALTASGIGDEAIIAKIQTSSANFNLSTAQMIALKKQGVSGPVIAAMINAGGQGKGVTAGAPASRVDANTANPRSANPASLTAPHPAGVYLFSEGRLVRIEFSVSSQTKTGGLLGTVMTSGIAATSINAIFQGESARTKTTERQPTFYFYFATSNAAAQAEAMGATEAAAPSSPAEFSLIRMTVKKGERRVRVGRANIGGVKTGVMDKDRVAFSYDELRSGAYSVKPDTPLEPGEYSFLIVGGGGSRTARIFDFSVQ